MPVKTIQTSAGFLRTSDLGSSPCWWPCTRQPSSEGKPTRGAWWSPALYCALTSGQSVCSRLGSAWLWFLLHSLISCSCHCCQSQRSSLWNSSVRGDLLASRQQVIRACWYTPAWGCCKNTFFFFSETVFTIEKKISNFYTFSLHSRKCELGNALNITYGASVLCFNVRGCIEMPHTYSCLRNRTGEGSHHVGHGCLATWGKGTLKFPRSRIWWWKWRRKNRKTRLSGKEESC